MEWIIGVVAAVAIVLYLGHRQNRKDALATAVGWDSAGPTFEAGKLKSGNVTALTLTEQRADAWLDVVGESHYQDNIAFHAGRKTPDGPEVVDHMVMLLPEPTNPHDPNAIAVCLRRDDGESHRVGYLSRQDALAYGPVIERVRPYVLVTAAKVTGGWDNGDGDTGSYGVRINLGTPAEVWAELDEGLETASLPLPAPQLRSEMPREQGHWPMPAYDPAVSDEVLEEWDGEYAGRSVCFTAPSMFEFRGQRVTRSMQELMAAQHGMEVRPSVTKGLDILVVGQGRPATAKVRKAVEYGATIVDEVTFWERLGVSFGT